MQILLPAYQFNLIMQQSLSTIADVIPSLIIMISKWKRMEVSGVYKQLLNNLIESFRFTFMYELASPIYQVASILNTAKLHHWYKRQDCEQQRKCGLDKMNEVFIRFAKHNTTSEDGSNQNDNQQENQDVDEDSMEGFLADISYQQLTDPDSERLELYSETIKLTKLIENNVCHNKTTAFFWKTYGRELSHLRKLALILLNIPSASSFIERHYSLCGAVCEKRRGNMKPESVIMRCMLKANLSILKGLNNVEIRKNL